MPRDPGMMHVLIDANVPLNVWLGDRPMAKESAAIMEAIGEGEAGVRARGITPPLLVVKNYKVQYPTCDE